MSEIIPEAPSQIMFFEDVLPKTGWGIYYKFMVGMACASHFAQAAAFTVVSFANPMWSCENHINNNISLDIHTSFLVGRAIGGLILSALCDVYGRKKFLTYSLVLTFLSTFIAAFGYNYYVIVMAVFFIGSGVDGSIAVYKVHLAEMLPQGKRGFILAFCDLFWTFGYIFIFVFASFMRTTTVVDHREIDMRLSIWRMMFALSGGFNLLLACASALLEESPRYFLNIEQNYLAHLILKQCFAINNSSYAEKLEVKESDLSHLILDYNLPFRVETTGHWDEFRRALKIVLQSIKIMFKKPFSGSCLIILAIKTVLLIFG